MGARADRTDHRSGLAAAPLVVCLVLVAWGLLAGSGLPQRYDDPRPGRTDTDLYAAVADRVADGQGYYEAVAVEQPGRGYPTSPVVTVREPTLAWFQAAVGPGGVKAAFLALALVVALAASAALTSVTRSRGAWVAASALVAVNGALLAASRAPETHEAWVGLLTVGAACLWARSRVVAAVGVLLLAALVRELAVVLLVLVLVDAAVRRGRRDALAAGAALVVFAVLYAWHAWRVADVVSAAGGSSGGWLGLLAWPGVVDGTRFGSVLVLLPHAVAAMLVPLAVLGWAGQRGRFAVAAQAVVAVAVVMLGVLGRPDNAYWGLMSSTLLLAGLAFAPAAVATGLRALFRPGTASRPLPFN